MPPVIRIRLRAAFIASCLSMLAACGNAGDTAPPVATPAVTLSKTDAVIGGPLDVRYRFSVASDAGALPADGWVFVHFLDTDGEMMWTDDHQPPTPMSQWKPGSTIEYTRTMFVPRFPYVGETRVELGLFSRASGQRYPLAADTRGQRSYQVATFNLQLQSDALFVVFKDGWHPVEQAEGSEREWQWTKGQATLAFRNPHKPVLLYVDVDRPGGMPDAQQVTMTLGEAVIDTFSLGPNQTTLRKVALTADQLGAGDAVELGLSVDRTFVPADVPELKSRDARELGIRVFHVFVEPR